MNSQPAVEAEIQLPPGGVCEWNSSGECGESVTRLILSSRGVLQLEMQHGNGNDYTIITEDPRIVLPVLERLWQDEVGRLGEVCGRAHDIGTRIRDGLNSSNKKRGLAWAAHRRLSAKLIFAQAQLAAVEAAWEALKR